MKKIQSIWEQTAALVFNKSNSRHGVARKILLAFLLLTVCLCLAACGEKVTYH